MGLFRKNIHYDAVTNVDPRYFTQNYGVLPPIGPLVASMGAQMFTELLLLRLHVEKGATFYVERGVSDDLQLTDFANGRFEDLPWPATTVEFNFEDPALGTMLIGKLSRKDLVETARDKLNVEMAGYSASPDHDHQMISLCQCSDGSGSCLTVHDEHTWPKLLESGALDSAYQGHAADLQISRAESVESVDLLKLCLKILAYASVPQYRPVPVTRGQLHHGEAKPGVRGRPSRPTFRVVYLPHVVHPTEPRPPAEPGEPGKAREFKGRRGHIRWFHSDFFVKMKGKWIYVAPVVVAGAEHLLAKIRKPT